MAEETPTPESMANDIKIFSRCLNLATHAEISLEQTLKLASCFYNLLAGRTHNMPDDVVEIAKFLQRNEPGSAEGQ